MTMERLDSSINGGLVTSKAALENFLGTSLKA